MKNRLIAMALVSAVTLSFAATVQADDRVETERKECDGGNANACNNLGLMYLWGDGIETDSEKGVSYVQRACDSGSALACSNLAGWYFSGSEGLEKDPKKAVALVQKACDGGEYKECSRLGRLYLYGDGGVEQDDAKALQNFSKACNEGGFFEKADGCFGVAVVHADGLGVARDYAKAAKYFGASCDSRSKDGCAALGDMHAEGIGMDSNFQEAVGFYSKACAAGDTDYCLDVGEIYEDGAEVAKDLALAGHHYRKACERGNAEGCAGRKRIYPNDGCPCFVATEILSVCPRPDADATQRLLQPGPDGGRKLECFSTRNYSPGSIMFEVYPAGSDGQSARCFMQSVNVPPFGSGGAGQDLDETALKACVQTLDGIGSKLGLTLTPE